jgi:hypothetical protein
MEKNKKRRNKDMKKFLLFRLSPSCIIQRSKSDKYSRFSNDLDLNGLK